MIEEEDQIVTLLGSLVPRYATIVTVLETKTNNLTLQFVQQTLINEEQKRVHANDKNGGPYRDTTSLTTQEKYRLM